MAPYVLADCIDSLSQAQSWFVETCSETRTDSRRNDSCSGSRIGFGFPSPGLFQAVKAGLVNYNPEEERACVDALLVQSCHGSEVWEGIPACADVFTCAVDAGNADDSDGGGTTVDGGGGPCSGVFLGPTLKNVPPVCSAASDCVEAKAPAGPYCIDGYCSSSPCGESSSFPCPTASLGQPCDAYVGAIAWYYGGAMDTARRCSAGLVCAGLSIGGSGTCAYPEDLGGPCKPDAAVTGCKLGLVCNCGTCQLPPTHGPCASGNCLAGVAYCDSTKNTCLPVKRLGEDCSRGEICASNLDCVDDVCQIYTVP
jgi:hypothetical protein